MVRLNTLRLIGQTSESELELEAEGAAGGDGRRGLEGLRELHPRRAAASLRDTDAKGYKISNISDET